MIKEFLHTGITVKNLDKSIAQYEKQGFKLTKRFERPDLKAKAVMMKHPDAGGLELWQWGDIGIPQIKFIKNHLAFLSDDLDADVQTLVGLGCEVVIPHTEGVVFNYYFVRDPDGTYLEIASEKPNKN